MLEPTRVIVEITMTDEITGRISKTRYNLNQAIYYKNGASEYHAQNADWVYQSLYSAVHAHLKAEPYVKPKRYKARYSTSICTWVIDGRNGLAAVLDELSRNDDEHREAAERIAAICEEVMP